MAGAVSPAGVLGLLLVSTLPGVLGDRSSRDLRAHPGNPAQGRPKATEPRRPPPPKHQQERAPAWPLGALYTAAVVAFVLYKCLQQEKNEAPVPQEEAGKKESLQSEQQLAQLTQQLAQTEQHLNSLMAQLDPLFERVSTLAGAQQELLNMKLHTIHQLLHKNKPSQEVPEPEAGVPFPEDSCVEEEDEEAGDSQAGEAPLHWSTETRSPATPWGVEQGLRRRCSKTAAKGRGPSPLRGEGRTPAEGLVKPSLFL
ncbi:coiled-coil domain-containing protein 107 isoform X1 [Pipistrellus kuhlii]|uniref:Coiled-coil domain containing 107 n=2 Tax=Pipistrellus kuhlii TaxID=59472 RepID=A0A7J7W2Z5_PIPKU|nr:coiled-coil domain-containing protein 107 isoform X1 [Pipistrellus kuhlii]KAF6331548.1 coiled-coil domain containing 107 [Pipistrellus kuhlii]